MDTIAKLTPVFVDAILCRQTGADKSEIIDHLASKHGLRRDTASSIVNSVDQELRVVRHKLELPLAVSLDSLKEDCVEIRQASPERR